VTNYPETHEIGAFCTGHTEYVSSIEFLNDENLLASASGDKTLRFWNYKTGKQTQKMNLSFIPVTIVVSNELMAISSEDNTIFIYSYSVVDSKSVKLNLLDQKKYSSEIEFVARDGAIYIKNIHEVDGKQKLLIEEFSDKSFKLFCDVAEALETELDSSFKLFKPFDVSLLFKKRYDNVKQYIDRKKARIECKESKKK
jgi:tRNA (guanine-N(7)-)-methyltransferase subunit TRM82